MTPVRRPLPHALRTTAIDGHHVPEAATVDSLLTGLADGGPALLVFLRHHG